MSTKIFLIFILGILLIESMSFINAFDWTNNLAEYYQFENNAELINGLKNLTVNDQQIGFVNGGLNGNAGNFSGAQSMNISNTAGDSNWNMSSPITINFWIYKRVVATEGILSRGSNKQYLYSKATIGQGVAGGGWGTNASFTDPIISIFINSTWTMITIRKNDTDTSIWANGTLLETETNNNSVDGLTDVHLGDGTDIGGANFRGMIDEMAIFNRSLSYAEIVELYNGGVGLFFELENVTLNSPINYYNTTISITFNCSARIEGSATRVNNISLWIDGIRNYTLSDGLDNFTSLEITKSLGIGEHNWTCSADDNSTTPLTQWATNNRTLTIKSLMENSQTYKSTTTSSSYETFKLNVSYVSSYYTGITATLNYNGTVYYPSKNIIGTEVIFSKSFNVPSVTAEQNHSFYWEISLINSTGTLKINSTMHNQTVDPILIDTCGVYTNQLFNLSIHDEKTQELLDHDIENTSIKVNIIIKDSASLLTLTNYSTNFSEINPARLCLKNAINSSYLIDGIIEYSSQDRYTEFYNIQNYLFDTSAPNRTIILYDLNTSQGREFKVTYKDANFVAVSGAVMQIQRKYIEEGVYKTTEVPKTGTEGYTIAHLVPNDVIYNIIIMKGGIVLGAFTDIVANCQNPLLSECNINLNSFSASVMPRSFATSDDITFTLTFNRTTRNVKSISSIISGVPSTILLNVTLFDNLGSTQVCMDSYYASGGELNCVVPTSYGNSTVVAKLYKDGKIIGQSIISLAEEPSELYGGNLIFIALVAILIIIGIAITDSPMTYGIIFIIGIIALVALNIIYTPSLLGVGATVLWFIVAIILILIKGSNRQ